MVKKNGARRTYQEYHNEWNQNGYNSFLVELAKYGLGKKDMAANLNLFSAVGVDDEGNLKYLENNSKAGDSIELRFEMDTLVLMHTCPHPLNPAEEYPQKAGQLPDHTGSGGSDDDYCLNFGMKTGVVFRIMKFSIWAAGCCHD